MATTETKIVLHILKTPIETPIIIPVCCVVVPKELPVIGGTIPITTSNDIVVVGTGEVFDD